MLDKRSGGQRCSRPTWAGWQRPRSLLNGVYVTIFIENIFTFQHLWLFLLFYCERGVWNVCCCFSTHTHIQHGKMSSLSPSSDRCVTLNLKWTPPPPAGCLIMSLHLISTDPHLSLPQASLLRLSSQNVNPAPAWDPHPGPGRAQSASSLLSRTITSNWLHLWSPFMSVLPGLDGYISFYRSVHNKTCLYYYTGL